MKYDSVLLVAFGGPTPGCCKKYDTDNCPGEAYCFVEGIAGEAESQKERVKDISSHYVKLGGFSPFNELTYKQAKALEKALQQHNLRLPVYAGFRHWTPYLKDVIAEMAEKGHRKILGIIMAPHQSKVSWEWYQLAVKKGIDAVEGEKPIIDYLDPWYTHNGYVGAIAEIIKKACGDKLERAELVFTAHAIPQVSADTSPYSQQFEKTQLHKFVSISSVRPAKQLHKRLVKNVSVSHIRARLKTVQSHGHNPISMIGLKQRT